MSATETRERLAEIRERAARAIPGPWFWRGNRKMDDIPLSNPHGGSTMIFDVDTMVVEYVHDHEAGETYGLAQAREEYLIAPELMPGSYTGMSLEELRELCAARAIEDVEAEEPDEDQPNAADYVDALLDWDSQRGYADWHSARELQREIRAFLSPGPRDPDEGEAHLLKGGEPG